jgi:hypothetical protein
MLFLATPHRGSDLVGTLKRILTVSIVSRNSKSYISEFKGGPRVVEVHNELFRHIAPKLKIFSFYETLRTSIGPNKLVRIFHLILVAIIINTPIDGGRERFCDPGLSGRDFEALERRSPQYLQVR